MHPIPAGNSLSDCFQYLCSLLLNYLIIAVSGLHFSTESTLFRRSMMKTKKLHSDSVSKNQIVQMESPGTYVTE